MALSPTINPPKLFKHPSVFSKSKVFIDCKTKFDQWIPLVETYCSKMGGFGENFLNYYAISKCQYIFDYEKFINISNRTLGGTYFSQDNVIGFGQSAFGSKEHFLHLAFHEAIHALQYNICTSLYTNLSNQNIFISLVPKDQVFQFLLIERDAEAKACLFMLIYDLINNNQINKANDLSNNNEYLQKYLIEISQTILNEATWEKDVNKYQYYIDYALDYCEDTIEWHLENKHQDFKFATLEKEDVWNLGQSLGLNSLYKSYDDIILDPPLEMTKKQINRLQILNENLGLNNKDILPLGDALKANNITRRDLLHTALSKENLS